MNGETRAPNLVTVVAIAHYLKVSVSEFIGDPVPAPPHAGQADQAALLEEFVRTIRQVQQISLTYSIEMEERLTRLLKLMQQP